MGYFRQHWGGLAFGLMVFVGAIWKLTPVLTNHYYRADGYGLLHQALDVLGEERAEPDFCVEGGVTNVQAFGLVEQAVVKLEKAREALPADAQTLLLLGRGYCLLGQVEEAVKAYEGYTALRPGNPLGYVELVQVYEISKELGTSNTLYDTWEKAGYQSDAFIDRGLEAFSTRDFSLARKMFYHAYFVSDHLSSDILFRWAVSSVMSTNKIPKIFPVSEIAVYSFSMDNQLKVDGSHLLWGRDNPDGKPTLGDPLGKYSRSPDNVGVMWWGGQAVMFVEAPYEGMYKISISVQHTFPKPIQLQVEINFKSIMQIELNRGDLSWEEFSSEVYLSKGVQLIGIHYLNNGVVDGLDRDAHIEWIKLEQK